jgi:uncharacterized membrane protein
MKTLKSRIVVLGAALAASVLLGLILLGPAERNTEKPRVPWSAAALLATGAGAAFWLRRRSRRAEREAGGRLRCLERLRLQPGKLLHLIEADGVRLLVSSGENGIRLVTRLEEEDQEAAS